MVNDKINKITNTCFIFNNNKFDNINFWLFSAPSIKKYKISHIIVYAIKLDSINAYA